jgi:hypothetical protein
MLKKRLAQVFALLLFLQSVGMMADMHASHQSGTEHLSFDHQHQHHDGQAKSDLALQKLALQKQCADFDCHHCCHCHGIQHHWIATNVSLPLPDVYKPTYSIQRYTLPPYPHENLLRPPIA